MTSSQRIVVVGASLAGLRSAEAIISRGWTGELVVIGDEDHMPYTRPPLSKALLGSKPDHSSVAFAIRPELAPVDWRLATTVTACDLDGRVIRLDDGALIEFDGLVIASGAHARRLPVPGLREVSHTVRNLADCIRLNAELTPTSRVVVVGAGFIGCEVAATARSMGCAVHVVDMTLLPLEAALGREAGQLIQSVHERRGVTFHLGRTVSEVTSLGDAVSLRLDDDHVLECDVVIEATGSVPSTGWLDPAQVDLVDGVLCDNSLRVPGRDDVVAVGDVARFPNPLFDAVPRRVEHWQMPVDTAQRAGTTLLAHLRDEQPDDTPFTPLPSFWSDQFDLRLQSFGLPALADSCTEISSDSEGGAVFGYFRDSSLVGAVMFGMRSELVRTRKAVLQSLVESLSRA